MQLYMSYQGLLRRVPSVSAYQRAVLVTRWHLPQVLSNVKAIHPMSGHDSIGSRSDTGSGSRRASAQTRAPFHEATGPVQCLTPVVGAKRPAVGRIFRHLLYHATG